MNHHLATTLTGARVLAGHVTAAVAVTHARNTDAAARANRPPANPTAKQILHAERVAARQATMATAKQVAIVAAVATAVGYVAIVVAVGIVSAALPWPIAAAVILATPMAVAVMAVAIAYRIGVANRPAEEEVATPPPPTVAVATPGPAITNVPTVVKIRDGLDLARIPGWPADNPDRVTFTQPVQADGRWSTVATFPAVAGTDVATAATRRRIAVALERPAAAIEIDTRDGHEGQVAISVTLADPFTTPVEWPRPAIDPAGLWDGVTLGHDPTGRPVVVDLVSATEGAGSILIVGATGSGKTTLMLNVAEQAAAGLADIVVVDPKLSPELAMLEPVAVRYIADINPAVTIREGAAALEWGYAEIRRRQAIMRANKVRNVTPDFAAEHGVRPLLFLVDEYLAMPELADLLAKVLQEGRQSLVFLCLGTQVAEASEGGMLSTGRRGNFRGGIVGMAHGSETITVPVLGRGAERAGKLMHELPGRGRCYVAIHDRVIEMQVPDVTDRLPRTVADVVAARPPVVELLDQDGEPVDVPDVVAAVQRVWNPSVRAMHLDELLEALPEAGIEWVGLDRAALSAQLRDVGVRVKTVYSPRAKTSARGVHRDDLDAVTDDLIGV